VVAAAFAAAAAVTPTSTHTSPEIADADTAADTAAGPTASAPLLSPRGGMQPPKRSARFEPVAFEPVAFEPVAFEPVAFEPVAFEPVADPAAAAASDANFLGAPPRRPRAAVIPTPATAAGTAATVISNPNEAAAVGAAASFPLPFPGLSNKPAAATRTAAVQPADDASPSATGAHVRRVDRGLPVEVGEADWADLAAFLTAAKLSGHGPALAALASRIFAAAFERKGFGGGRPEGDSEGVGKPGLVAALRWANDADLAAAGLGALEVKRARRYLLLSAGFAERLR
jgi:hypothetical protein